MFPRKNRVTDKKEFDLIFRKGRTIYSDAFFIKVLKNELDYNRYGFIVSKKVSNKAVARNKIKRIMREVFKLNQDRIKKSFDIVVYAKPAIKSDNFQEIQGKIEKIIGKI
ncbi:ribonuclease P protein component [Patescibacteria group bacterium]